MKFTERITAALLLTVFALPLANARTNRLPEKAAQAIRMNFPDAKITSVGRERERGAWYYEVNLADGKRRIEVEVTEEGVIGEIEAKVLFTDLPKPLQVKVRKRVGKGRLVRVEKHERRGVARSGKFVPISKPRISYEVKYYDVSGKRRELQLASSAVLEVPEEVLAMVGRNFPKARVREVEMEDDDGVPLYVLSLREEKTRFTVVSSREGFLVEREERLTAAKLPGAARSFLGKSKDWQRASSSQVSGWDTYLVVEDGELVKHRDQTYIVILKRKKRVKEYRFDGRGRLTSESKWQDADFDGDDHHDDEDGDDEHGDDDDEHDDDDREHGGKRERGHR